MNFLHGIPHFAISIALEREGTIVAGVVYNPANDELFTAERGKGAFLNDQRLRVAARKRLADAVIACALPHPSRGDVGAHAQRASSRCRTRSPGCAGSAPPRSISPGSRPAASTPIGSATSRPGTWRPASLLVREAGGFVTDLDGRDDMLKTGGILGGNEDIHRELLGC